jgi:hypothetical protein
LGTLLNKKGYKCFHPIKQKLHISCNVHFFENEPFYKDGNDITANDFVTIILPELTFFKGTLPEVVPSDVELPSGGNGAT